MTIYDLKDDAGRVFAFEVDNSVLGRRGLCRVVSGIPGATLLREPVKHFSWFRESTFCEFELDGVRFSADEGPWGDDSRYWIGPDPPRFVPQVRVVRQAFVDHQPLPERVRARPISVVILIAIVALIAWAYLFARP